VQVAPHPEGEQLQEYITSFGRRNTHLAAGKAKQAAWWVGSTLSLCDKCPLYS
jgi:hypothetical protein